MAMLSSVAKKLGSIAKGGKRLSKKTEAISDATKTIADKQYKITADIRTRTHAHEPSPSTHQGMQNHMVEERFARRFPEQAQQFHDDIIENFTQGEIDAATKAAYEHGGGVIDHLKYSAEYGETTLSGKTISKKMLSRRKKMQRMADSNHSRVYTEEFVKRAYANESYRGMGPVSKRQLTPSTEARLKRTWDNYYKNNFDGNPANQRFHRTNSQITHSIDEEAKMVEARVSQEENKSVLTKAIENNTATEYQKTTVDVINGFDHENNAFRSAANVYEQSINEDRISKMHHKKIVNNWENTMAELKGARTPDELKSIAEGQGLEITDKTTRLDVLNDLEDKYIKELNSDPSLWTAAQAYNVPQYGLGATVLGASVLALSDSRGQKSNADLYRH